MEFKEVALAERKAPRVEHWGTPTLRSWGEEGTRKIPGKDGLLKQEEKKETDTGGLETSKDGRG